MGGMGEERRHGVGDGDGGIIYRIIHKGSAGGRNHGLWQHERPYHRIGVGRGEIIN